MNSIVHSTAVFLAVTGFGAVAVAADKVTECNQISTIVNQAANDSIAASNSSNPDKISVLEQTATAIDRNATKLTALEIQDKSLVGFQTRFVKMYQDTVTASRSLVAAARAQDEAAMNQSLKTLEAATNQESSLVNEFNQYCGAK